MASEHVHETVPAFGSTLADALAAARMGAEGMVEIPLVPHDVLNELATRDEDLELKPYIGFEAGDEVDPAIFAEVETAVAGYRGGGRPNLRGLTTLSLTVLFNVWLRDLPEPIVPEGAFGEVIQTWRKASLESAGYTPGIARQMVVQLQDSLPEANLLLLEKMLPHFHSVLAHAVAGGADPDASRASLAAAIQPLILVGGDDEEEGSASLAVEVVAFLFSEAPLHQFDIKEARHRAGTAGEEAAAAAAEAAKLVAPPQVTACRKCRCRRMIPNRFIKSLCKHCGHQLSDHGPAPSGDGAVAPAEPAAGEGAPAARMVTPASAERVAAIQAKFVERGPPVARHRLVEDLQVQAGVKLEERSRSPAQLRWDAIKEIVSAEETVTENRCTKKGCTCKGFLRNKFMATLCKQCGHETFYHQIDEETEHVPDAAERLLTAARAETARLKKLRESLGATRYWSPMRRQMEPTIAHVSTKKAKSEQQCTWCDCEGFWRNRFHSGVCRACGHPRDAHETDPDLLFEDAAGECAIALKALIAQSWEEDLRNVQVTQLRWRQRAARRELVRLRHEKLHLDTTVLIQSVWRMGLAVRELARLRHDKLRTESATRIQSVWRMGLAFRELARLRLAKLRLDSATLIQSVWRMGLAFRELARLRHEKLRLDSATLIQSVWRMGLAFRELARLRLAKLRLDSATLIQSVWRMGLAFRELARLREERRRLLAAILIQSNIRMTLAKIELTRLKTQKALEDRSRLVMQRVVRGKAGRIQAAQMREEKRENDAATTVQRIVRGQSGRAIAAGVREEKLQLRSAVLVQCAIRRMRSRVVAARLRQAKCEQDSALAMQRVWRGKADRIVATELRREKLELESAIRMQSVARGRTGRRVAASARQEQRELDAARLVQRVWRGTAGRMDAARLRQDNKELAAAIVVQSGLRGRRGRLAAAKLRHEKRELDAARFIQRVWLGKQGRLVAAQTREDKHRLDATCALQRVWRGRTGRVEAMRVRRAKDELDATCALQRVWRGKVGRLEAARLREEALRLSSACAIQRAHRCSVARGALAALQEEDRRLKAAIVIQRVMARGCADRRRVLAIRRERGARSFQACRRAYAARRVLWRLRRDKLEKKASTEMQRHVRGYLARALHRRMVHAEAKRVGVVGVQSVWRMFVARQVLAGLKQDALDRASALVRREQAAAERAAMRKAAAAKMAADERAAIAIQRVTRGHAARKTAAEMRHSRRMTIAVMAVQVAIRGYRARKAVAVARAEAEREAAATSVQAGWRGRKARQEAAVLREEAAKAAAAITMQRAARADAARRARDAERTAEREDHAARVLQGVWNCAVARRQRLALAGERDEAYSAQVIQRIWRGEVGRRQASLAADARSRAAAAVVVQSAWRRYRAVHAFQAVVRAKMEMESAIKLQAIYRRRLAQRTAAREAAAAAETSAAVAVQCVWRGRTARRSADELRTRRECERAAVAVQRVHRGRMGRRAAIATRRTRSEDESARCLQAWWREHSGQRLAYWTARAVRLSLRERAAAESIQASWRMVRAQRVASRRRGEVTRFHATIRIQSIWRMALVSRATAVLREKRDVAKKGAATAIQRRVRGLTTRKSVADLRRTWAAERIQPVWRGYVARRQFRHERGELTSARRENAAIHVQSAVRRRLAVAERLRRRDYRAATLIQSRWRGAAARIFADKLQIQRTRTRAATTIQSAFRSSQAKDFFSVVMRLARHNAYATKIQRLFRGVAARNKVARVRREIAERRQAATLTLQRVGRGFLVRRRLQYQNESAQQKLAALFVQRVYRGFKARDMRRRIVHDRDRNASSRAIQRKWRSYSLQQRLDRARIARRMSILIQAVLRGKLARIRYRIMRESIAAGHPRFVPMPRLCDNDLRSEATVYCWDCEGGKCGRAYCGVCAQYLHMPPDKRTHRVEKLAPLIDRSVLTIQTNVRGFLGKCRAHNIRRANALNKTARLCQRLSRGQAARRWVASEKELQRSQFPLKCANCLASRATVRCDTCDACFCGVCRRYLHKPAHKRLHHIVPFIEYQDRKAHIIQPIIRGYLGKCRAMHRRDELKYAAIILFFQAVCRRNLQRIRTRRLQEGLTDEFRREADGSEPRRDRRITRPRPCSHCRACQARRWCVDCQRWYCGICARQLHLTPLLRLHHREHLEERHRTLAATRIQAHARKTLARMQRSALAEDKRRNEAATVIQLAVRRTLAVREVERQREIRSRLCQHCIYTNREIATLMCRQCQRRYCNACSAILHRPEEMRGHVRVPIGLVAIGAAEAEAEAEADAAAIAAAAAAATGEDEAAEVAAAEALAGEHVATWDYLGTVPSNKQQTQHYEVGDTGAMLVAAEASPWGVVMSAAECGAVDEEHTLDLSGREYTVAPTTVFNALGIRALILARNSLVGLPDQINALANSLMSLDVSENRIDCLPYGLGALTNLVWLHAPRNGMSRIPNTFTQLASLEVLDLESNRFRDVPEIWTMRRVRALNLNGNLLARLQPELARLGGSLRRLDVARNRLQVLPESVCTLTQLRRLDFSENMIDSLPSGIGRLKHLVEMRAADCRLLYIPDTIIDCAALEHLVVNGNRLETVPWDSLGALPKLSLLELGGNRLTEVSPVLAAATALRTIGLWSNDLSGLPEELEGLTGLTVLDVADNPRFDVPQLEREKGPAAVLAHAAIVREENELRLRTQRELERRQNQRKPSPTAAVQQEEEKEEEETHGAASGDDTEKDEAKEQKEKGGFEKGEGAAGTYRYLGEGWYEYYNPGRNYFHNVNTQETRWDRPVLKPPEEEEGLVAAATSLFAKVFE